MQSELTFRLFGAFEVVDAAGRPLDLGTRKQRAVLAMLALEPGRVVPLDRLIEELWAGEAPSGATGGLQAYISHLRRVLEPDRRPRTPPSLLLTREPGYVLAVPPGQVDLTRFAAEAEEGRRALALGEHARALRVLDQALALWRGEPLAEFADQEFAQPTLAKLAELRVAAVENRFEARLELGEAGACVPDLEALVEAHPYRERLWGLLVLALYRTGRQADALAALRRVRALLVAELGIEPGPELRRLEQSVFDQAAELELTAPAAPDRAASVPVGGGLVAREAQLRLVDRRLTETRQGRGGVLLVTGEAGIGKTRLAQAAADEAAARGFRVAWGRCLDGTAPAFWPWTQILGVLPAPHPTRDPEEALFELYRQVTAMLTDGGPRLVMLEDLHWADVSSLRLLAFVAGELARHSVLVVATLRPEPGDNPGRLRDTLGALAGEDRTERVPLASFAAADVAAYLRHRHVEESPELVGLLLERTGGNPFYLAELLRLRDSEQGLADGLPPGARDVIERRVARLPEQTQELLRVAAVTGRDVEIDLLEAITDTPAEQVMSLLEPAVATGLLTETPGGFDYRFSHALVRDAVHSGLGRLRRARLHLRAGEWLAAQPHPEPVRLAHHFAQAAKVGGAARAVEHASLAARQATARLAYAEAVELWELALAALSPGDDAGRCAVLSELGQARRTVGDPVRARRDMDEAVRLALKTGDRQALAGAVTSVGSLSVWNWRPYGEVNDRIVDVLADLLDEHVDDHMDDSRRAVLLGTLGMELAYGPRRAEGERYAVEAVKLARAGGDTWLRARTLNNYLLVSWVPEHQAERLDAVEEMLALPDLPILVEVVALVFRMAILMRLGDLAGWDRDLARCRHLVEDGRRPELVPMVRMAETTRRTLEGNWAQAEALVAGFGELKYGSTVWGPASRRLATTFTVRRAQGRVAEILDELVTTAGEPTMIPLRPLAVLAALDVDRPGLAHELIARWGTEIRQDWTTDFVTAVWGFVAARLGSPDPEELYGRLLPYADRLMVSGIGTTAWGSTHLVLAELAARLGRLDRAREHARAAAETHHRLGLTYLEQVSRELIDSLE